MKKNGKFIVCAVCSKQFYVPLYRVKTAITCSSKCSGFLGGKSVKNRKNTFVRGHKTNLGKRLSGGFSKGNKPWNAGKRFSPSYRRKLSKAHLGQIAWNKGTGQSYKLHRGVEWKLWREVVFARDNFTCQICRKRGGKLDPHHIKPASIFPEMVYNIDNGKTLCVPCHKKTDSYGSRAISKRRELQERLSKLTCSEAWEATLTNVQRLEAETFNKVGNASTSALAPA